MANETDKAVATQTIKVVATFTEDSPMIQAMAVLLADARKKNFRPGIGEHSVQYWCEEFLSNALHDFKGAMERDHTRRTNEAYLSEEKKMVIPAATASPDAWVAYGKQLSNLRRKYGIGGTQQEV